MFFEPYSSTDSCAFSATERSLGLVSHAKKCARETGASTYQVSLEKGSKSARDQRAFEGEFRGPKRAYRRSVESRHARFEQGCSYRTIRGASWLPKLGSGPDEQPRKRRPFVRDRAHSRRRRGATR